MSTSMPLRLWVRAPRIVIWSFMETVVSCRLSVLSGLWAEDFDEEETGADDDAAVGCVEVRPVVGVDVDLEEVDDVVVADTVVEVADGSAEDEGEGYGADRYGAADSPEHGQEDEDGEDGEGDENIADGDGGGGLGEHAEGCAGVVDVGDAEDAGDDGVGLAVGELMDDDAFGDAVDEDDGGRDDEHDDAVVAGLHVVLRRCRLVDRGHQACGSIAWIDAGAV